MSKRLQLQQYLDSQLQRVNGEGEGVGAFDRLEEKLSKIEKKLVLLKDQNLVGSRVSRASKAPSEGKQKKEYREADCQYEGARSKVKEEVSRREQEVQMTPEKQLKIISKTMSEGFLQLRTGSKQKSKKKKYESAARTIKQRIEESKSPTLHLTVKKGKTKSGNSCKKLTYNSTTKVNKTHDAHLADLKRDIDLCIRSNQQLKTKVRNLQVYKTQYCRLKELFEKCEKARKKKKV